MRMKGKALCAAVALTLLGLLFSPVRLEGAFDDRNPCLCDSIHFVYFHNGKVSSMATKHEVAEYFGSFRRVGLWKNEFSSELVTNRPIKQLKVAFYSFPLFNIAVQENGHWQFSRRLWIDTEMREYLGRTRIRTLVIESDDEIYCDYWDSDFKYITRKYLRPKVRS